MRSLIIILEGAADYPLEELSGRTPLQAAQMPALSGMLRYSRLGLQTVIPPAAPPLAELSLFSCLGFDGTLLRPSRGIAEGLAAGLEIGRRDLALRCSFINADDGKLIEASPANVSAAEGKALVEIARGVCPEPQIELHFTGQHRAVAIWRDGAALNDLETTPPHELLGKPLGAGLPRGRGSRVLIAWMRAVAQAISEAELNAVRSELGESPLAGMWLWGQGVLPRVPMFRERFGRGAVLVTNDLLTRGLGKLARLELQAIAAEREVSNESGNGGIAASAIQALQRSDTVVVHTRVTDAAGHRGDAREKTKALEGFDAHVLAPLIAELTRDSAWRLLLVTAHATPVSLRRHVADATPILLASERESDAVAGGFDELHAAQGSLRIPRGHELLEYFFRV